MLFGNQITGKLLAEIIAAQHRPASSERDRLLLSQQQAPRNQSPIDQLRHYKPTEEQRLQALKDMANMSKDKMIQGIADYEIKKYERESLTEVLPRQIEMPNFPIINRSESEWELKRKATDFFWDTLEGILPK